MHHQVHLFSGYLVDRFCIIIHRLHLVLRSNSTFEYVWDSDSWKYDTCHNARIWLVDSLANNGYMTSFKSFSMSFLGRFREARATYMYGVKKKTVWKSDAGGSILKWNSKYKNTDFLNSSYVKMTRKMIIWKIFRIISQLFFYMWFRPYFY